MQSGIVIVHPPFRIDLIHMVNKILLLPQKTVQSLFLPGRTGTILKQRYKRQLLMEQEFMSLKTITCSGRVDLGKLRRDFQDEDSDCSGLHSNLLLFVHSTYVATQHRLT